MNGNIDERNRLRGRISTPDVIHGKSAYEIAVMHGFDGTEEEWIKSITEPAENAAKAEIERIESETIRKSNESERIENEAARVNNEAERVNAEAERTTEFESWRESFVEYDARITRNDKRITNLEQGIVPDPFETDSSVAYVKSVPTNALPYAEIGKVGGMTRKSKNLFDFVNAKEAGGSDVAVTRLENGIRVAANNDGTYRYRRFLVIDDITTLKGKTVIASSNFVANNSDGRCDITLQTATDDIPKVDEGTTLDNGATSGRIVMKLSIPTNTAATKLVIAFYATYSSGAAGDFADYTNIQVEIDDTVTDYEPYYEGLRSAKVTEIGIVGKNLFDDSILSGAELEFTKIAEHEYFCDKLWLAEGKKLFVNTSGISGSFAISGKLKYKDVGSTSSGLIANVFYTDGTNQKFPPSTTVQGVYFDYKVVTNASKTVDYIGFTYGSSAVHTYVKDFQIEKGTVATECAPYTKTSFPIPAEVQALDGYGEGNPDNIEEFNYIDFERQKFVAYGHIVDGAWVAYDAPIETDISDLISEDNFIEVEGGATITMVNEHSLAAPSEITYMLKEEVV